MCRARTTSRRHKSFPVLRSSASVISLSSSLAVRKTRSAVTTGDDRAKGTVAFQARFFVELNSAGSVEPSATPVPFGPRNCGHSAVFLFCAYVGEPATTNNAIATKKRVLNLMFESCLEERNPHVLSGQRYFSGKIFL